MLLLKLLDDAIVQPLDKIVSLLVKLVDSALDPGQFRVGNTPAACNVFFVPKLEITLVLAANNVQKPLVAVVDFTFVPFLDGFLVKVGNRFNIDHSVTLKSLGSTLGANRLKFRIMRVINRSRRVARKQDSHPWSLRQDEKVPQNLHPAYRGRFARGMACLAAD